VRLVDLQPKWLSKDVFIFRSPAGAGDWITCKRVAMSTPDQYALIYKDNPEYVGQSVVCTVPEMVWSIDGDNFETMTVSPSLDFSASGNWHGFIRQGNIVG
jgi:hypothetical protein